MITSSFEALASAWARIAEEAEIPATNDMRLFGLLHLLGQASLRMEQTLWPKDYERMAREVEQALRDADDPNAKCYTNEEVMQAMQECIGQAQDKPC